MKRSVTVKIEGKEYPLCCTLGAVEEIEAKYGNMQKFIDAATKEKTVSATITALDILLRHGAKRAKQLDGAEIEPVDIEAIRDNLDLSDIGVIAEKVWDAINVSMRNEIKAVPKSKKKATE